MFSIERLVTTVILSLPLLPAPPASAEFNDAALTRTLEALRAETETIGFAIGLIENGELVYARGFGDRSLGRNEPVDADTNFHWASVSKPFVATAIMQLEERDKLELDVRLVDVLPDYKITDARQREISIRQILLHTSGLPDVEDYEWDKPKFDDDALKQWALEDSPRELLFDPGSSRSYSNVGYEILGHVIELISGLTFADYMLQNIFEPLGMPRSTFYYPETSQEYRTAGHGGQPGSKHRTENYPYNRRHEPSSTLNTSINEISAFARALLDGGELDGTRILLPDTLKDMWAPRWIMDEDPLKAATMGWVYQEREGTVMVRHFGGDDGFRSALILLPDTKSAILFATNDEDSAQGEILFTALSALTADGD